MSEIATAGLKVGNLHRDGGLLRRWVVNVTVGEMIGFLVPAGVWGALATAGLADAAIYLPVVLAGVGEGAVLGWAQSRVLVDAIDGFDRRAWIRNTALAAGVAWSLGMLPSLLLDVFGGSVSDFVLIIVAAAAGVAMLLSIGWAQSLVLRRYVPHTGSWIAINALAWFVGLPFTFAAFSLAPEHAVLRELAALAGGLGMAATVALLTGSVLVWLLAPPDGVHA
jgi:hypothetical protein